MLLKPMQSQKGVSSETDSQEQKKVHSPDEMSEMLRYLVRVTVTREDVFEIVNKAISEAKYELKDHTSREVAKIRDSIYVGDQKTNEFVRTAQKSRAISRADADRLVAINPLKSMTA